MSFLETIMLSPGEEMRESSTKVLPLGTRGVTRDGRAFRYAKAGATVVAGLMVISPVPDEMSSPATSSRNYLEVAGVVGDDHFHLRVTEYADATALAANKYAGGYVWYGNTAPETIGQYFPIKAHPAMTALATYNIKVDFEKGYQLEEAVGTSIGMAMIKNPFDGVINVTQGAAPTSVIQGVAPRNATSGNYFWVQTWGPCVIKAGGTVTAFYPVGVMTDGAETGIMVGTSYVMSILGPTAGFALCQGMKATYTLVDLRLNP